MPDKTETAETTKQKTSDESTGRTWPVVVTLKHPFDYGDTRIESLTLRRGSLKQFKGMKLGTEIPVEQLILIASRLSGQPVGVIEGIDMEDAGEVMAAALDFCEQCLRAGRKPSQQ